LYRLDDSGKLTAVLWVSHGLCYVHCTCTEGPCYTETWKTVVGGQNMYSAETIAVASTICILVSLSAGCSLGFLVATYRRSAVRDLTSRAQTRRWSADKDGTEVVSNGVASVPLARLYAVFGSSRQGTVTSHASDGSTSTRATLNKACQTVGGGGGGGGGGSSKSTPTRRPASVSASRRANSSCQPNSAVFVSNYARRPSAML